MVNIYSDSVHVEQWHNDTNYLSVVITKMVYHYTTQWYGQLIQTHTYIFVYTMNMYTCYIQHTCTYTCVHVRCISKHIGIAIKMSSVISTTSVRGTNI